MSKYEVTCLSSKPKAKISTHTATKIFKSFVKACLFFHKLQKADFYKVTLRYCKDSEGNNE